MDGTRALELALVAAVLLVVTMSWLLWRTRRDRDLAEEELALASAETAQLRGHVRDLEGALRRARRGDDEHPLRGEVVERRSLVGRVVGQPDTSVLPDQVATRVVVNATLGEVLVRSAALAHGVRRALTPANRNRIRFEIRQATKQARKQRRRETRAAWRDLRSEGSAA